MRVRWTWALRVLVGVSDLGLTVRGRLSKVGGMFHKPLVCSLAPMCLVSVLSAASVYAADSWTQGVMMQESADRPGVVRIEVDGELFAEYHSTGASRPYLYPVLAADGTPVSRRWPLEDSDDEEHDHPHHKSLWHAHGSVNGVDFWSESKDAGQTVHVEFLEVSSGREVGVISTRNELRTKEGKRLATADHTLRVYREKGVRVMDYDVVYRATDGEIVFGDTKEGTMAIRLAESMRLKPNRYNEGKPTGHILSSEGVKDGATWGKRAAWVDYHAPVGGREVGVAIMDHPSNPRHPSWWHVRDYGLFAANPFGVHDFERKPAGTGDMKVPAGGTLTFRYRFVVHSGDEVEGRVAERYEAYVKAGK